MNGAPCHGIGVVLLCSYPLLFSAAVLFCCSSLLSAIVLVLESNHPVLMLSMT
jgi:hypothetical protein